MKICAVFLTVAPAGLSAQSIAGTPDLLLQYDPTGVFGVQLISAPRAGWFAAVRFSLRGPEGVRLPYILRIADVEEADEFTGFSRRQYLSAGLGGAASLFDRHLILTAGLGFLRTRRYRQYFSPDAPAWRREYWIRDEPRQRTALDLTAGANVRIGQIIVGIGYGTATGSITVRIGWSVAAGLTG